MGEKVQDYPFSNGKLPDQFTLLHETTGLEIYLNTWSCTDNPLNPLIPASLQGLWGKKVLSHQHILLSTPRELTSNPELPVLPLKENSFLIAPLVQSSRHSCIYITSISGDCAFGRYIKGKRKREKKLDEKLSAFTILCLLSFLSFCSHTFPDQRLIPFAC